MTELDPRIHVSVDHLRRLQAESAGLSFLPRHAAVSALNGRHGSRLRGRGLDFEEMRNYLPGDDIRAIDWKTTARTGSPYVKVMTEERDRPALLVVDQRMSMFFGSRLNMKSVTAAEAAVIAAYRVQAQGDRVGGIVFNDTEHQAFHPSRGQFGLNAFVSVLSQYNQKLSATRVAEPESSLNQMLGQVAKIAHHNHLVMVFSDFGGVDAATEQRLSGIAEHNDLVLMLVHDPVARNLKSDRPMSISDGHHQAELDLQNAEVTDAVREVTASRLDQILAWQQKINLSVLSLSTDQETLPQIRQLLGATVKRQRVR